MAAPDGNSTVTEEMFEQLSSAFAEFQNRAEKLSHAYEAMQEDFKRVNIELDKKNKELAESLHVQEETRIYLNSILESMTNGVVAVDNSGKITLFNSAASSITGHQSENIIHQHFDDVFSNHEFTEKNVINILKSGEKLIKDEKVIWNKEGKPVPVSFQGAPLKDQNGKKIGAVEIFSDISKLKDLENEMQQSRTMAALGEMSATVAHEIRNPLGAMGVWAGLLDRDFEKDDPRRETLSKLTSALGRLNKIVSNLLVYSRPVNAQFRDVPLNEILEEIAHFMELEAQRLGYEVEVKTDWDESRNYGVWADPEKLQQIIMNLCLNSVQAMPTGGLLSVSCEDGADEDKGFVQFTIRDTGEGITKEHLDKIFDPFHTTKENGTGLGLAIVKKFIDYHSGHISVRSQPGDGTQFSVFLPSSKGEV